MAPRKGYKPKRVVYRLADIPGHDGLWVEAYSCTIGEIFHEKTDLRLSRVFGERCLKDWNLLDQNDQPVPATLAGLDTVDVHLVATLVKVWVDAIMSVSDPLESSSNDGASSVEGLIPMEPLSESQAS